MSQNVFAHGSNMCSGRFRAYGVHSEGAGRSAVLTGYRLLFNKQSTDGSGQASHNIRLTRQHGLYFHRYAVHSMLKEHIEHIAGGQGFFGFARCNACRQSHNLGILSNKAMK